MRLIVYLTQYVENVISTNTAENIWDILLSFFSTVITIRSAFLHLHSTSFQTGHLSCALSHMWVVAAVLEQFQVISCFQVLFWRPPFSFCLGCLVCRPGKHSYHPETPLFFLIGFHISWILGLLLFPSGGFVQSWGVRWTKACRWHICLLSHAALVWPSCS